MRIGKVIGTVTLNRRHEAVPGGRLLVIRPQDVNALKGSAPVREEIVVAYDELSAAPPLMVGVSEGREAAMPFWPQRVPVDAYTAAILDTISVKWP